MGEFDPECLQPPEVAGFKQLKILDIGDIISTKERISFLDSCSRFGHVFIGRQNGFDVYKASEIESAKNEPKPLVSVSLKGTICDYPKLNPFLAIFTT